jgi:hypothetical protein
MTIRAATEVMSRTQRDARGRAGVAAVVVLTDDLRA